MTTTGLRYSNEFFAEPDLFLCVDDALVHQFDGATAEFCPLQKHDGPVLEMTEKWEGGDGHQSRPTQQDPPMGTVLWDTEQSQYVLWYASCNREIYPVTDPALGIKASVPVRPEGSMICMATSKDGVHWDRPRVGEVQYRGRRDNNMINVAIPPVRSDHLSTVMPDYSGLSPAGLIGSIYSSFDDPIYPMGITQMSSSEGIHWQPHFPPTLALDGDAHCLMWDPARKCFLCTTRSAQHGRIVSRLRARYPELKNKRHIALAMSRDLLHWTPMLDILEADEHDPDNAQMYMMYIVPYGHAYLGFVEMFYMSEDMTHGPLDMQLALSTDLVNWRRVGGRQPFIARGEKGTWDSAHTLITTNPPFAEGDRLRFWYGGKDTEHWQAGRSALSTGTIRRDGFGCWTAGASGGTVTTTLFDMNWATWPMLNVDATDGSVRMEILDEACNPIAGCSAAECVPVTGDHHRAIVKFNSNFETFVRHTGKVRFRFHLKNAKLYAFKVPNARMR